MSEWRDISDAPKDGTDVDLWVVDYHGSGERVVDAYWNGEKWRAPLGDHGYHDDVEYEPLLPETPYRRRATHWMLPPGPPA